MEARCRKNGCACKKRVDEVGRRCGREARRGPSQSASRKRQSTTAPASPFACERLQHARRCRRACRDRGSSRRARPSRRARSRDASGRSAPCARRAPGASAISSADQAGRKRERLRKLEHRRRERLHRTARSSTTSASAARAARGCAAIDRRGRADRRSHAAGASSAPRPDAFRRATRQRGARRVGRRGTSRGSSAARCFRRAAPKAPARCRFVVSLSEMSCGPLITERSSFAPASGSRSGSSTISVPAIAARSVRPRYSKRPGKTPTKPVTRPSSLTCTRAAMSGSYQGCSR